MSFNKKRKKTIIINSIYLSLLLIVLITSLGIYSFKSKNIKSIYEAKLKDLEFQIYENKRLVYIPKYDIIAGKQLKKEMFEKKEISLDIAEDDLISEEDFDKYSSVLLKSKLPVLKNMLNNELIDDNLREQEFNMFLLQTNLEKDNFIDVRINYPNGESYIILSKKRIQELDLINNSMILWLNEKEIMLIESAIIDAYLHVGTKIYTTKYVQPNIQNKTTETYIANKEVLKLMEINPNIIEKAKTNLYILARKNLEDRLKNLNEVQLKEINSGREEEINRAKEKITKDNEKNQIKENEEKIDKDNIESQGSEETNETVN